MAAQRFPYVPLTHPTDQAIEAWIRSPHKDSLEEACTLLQDLLTNDGIISSNDEEELDSINSAFAQVIHALLERYDPGDDVMHNPQADLIDTAKAMEETMIDLYDDQGLALAPNTTAMNAMIALHGAKYEVDEAIAIHHRLIEAEDNRSTAMAPNRVSYNSVINACAKDGRYQDASELLRLMMSRNKQGLSHLKPDLVSFNILLNAYSNSGEGDAGRSAERILDWMEELAKTDGYDLSPDAYSYTAVIDAYSKSSSPERAEAVLHRLLRRQGEGYNVAPTVVTFTAVLHALSKTRDKGAPTKAATIVRMMEQLHRTTGANVSPTTATYNAQLNVWNKNRYLPDAMSESLRILDDMRSHPDGAKPNCRTYSIVISTITSARKKDNLHVAEALVKEMQNSSDPAVWPNSITYNCLLNALANSKQKYAASRAQEIFSHMKDKAARGTKQVAPITQTYNIMMKIVARTYHRGGAGAEKAEQLLNELERLSENGGLRPTTVSYTTCITAWGRSFHERKLIRAHLLMERMKEAYYGGNRDAKPNTTSYNTLLSCYKNVVLDGEVNAGDRNEVIRQVSKLLDEMRSSEGCRPNEISYFVALKTLGNLPNRDERLLGTMKQVFRFCQEDKMMDEKVLVLLQRSAPAVLR